MFDIDISDALQHPGRTFDCELEGQPELEDVALSGPVHVHAEYTAENDTLRVGGTVSAHIQTNCSRCLRELENNVEEQFDEVFTARQQNGDSYTYSRDAKRANLDQMIRDLLLTAMPMQQLCREDCLGLCPDCGADLNEGPCGCSSKSDAVSGDNPFAKLKDLF